MTLKITDYIYMMKCSKEHNFAQFWGGLGDPRGVPCPQCQADELKKVQAELEGANAMIALRSNHVISMCGEGGHKFVTLPDHPTKDGKARCPYCTAIGLDRCREELDESKAETAEPTSTVKLKPGVTSHELVRPLAFDWKAFRKMSKELSPIEEGVITAQFRQVVDGNDNFEDMSSAALEGCYVTFRDGWICARLALQPHLNVPRS